MGKKSILKLIETAAAGFDKPECQRIEVPFEQEGENPHRKVIENFAAAILHSSLMGIGRSKCRWTRPGSGRSCRA